MNEIESLRRKVAELQTARDELERLQTSFQQETKRFSLITNNMLDAVAQLDPRGIFVYISPSHEQIFGFKPEKRLGLPAFSFIHPEDVEVVRNVYAHHLASREPNTLEFRYRLGDGTYCWVESSGNVIVNENNEVEGMIISSRPIEERKKAELALKASERLYRSLIENVRDVFFRIDAEGEIIMISPSGAKLLGYEKPEQLFGKNLFHHFFAHVDESKVFLQRMQENGYVDDFEITLRTRDGKMVQAAASSHFYEDVDGISQGIEGTIRDITLRKQSEEIIRKSEEKFRTLIETSSVGISITDGERYLYVNPTTQKMLGFSEEEFYARQPYDFVVPESRELIRQRAKDRLAGKPVPERYEISLLTKDGSVKWVEIGAAVIEYNNRPTIIFTQYDITDRKNAEAEKESLQEQLNHARKREVIGTLAAGIAHDFNNVLSGIQGHCALIQFNTSPHDANHKHLLGIENQVRSGAHLTRQLLDMAEGKSYEMKPTDINLVLKESTEVFARAKKGIAISWRLEENLWPVEAHAGQISQIFLNLFINAAQAMKDEGTLSLETKNLTLHDGDEKPSFIKPGMYVQISVTDTGCGMDRQTMDNAFHSFFSQDRRLGAGLGLTSSYNIIKNHQGYITVESELGVGTTFRIYLPVAKQTAPGAARERLPLLKGHETILLVDDEAIIAETTKAILELLGYHTLLAGSGQEAIAVFMEKGSAIDLVILDMVMPSMGGARVFEALRAINPDICIILYSGYPKNEEVQKLLEYGGCLFVQKPFGIDDLSQKIRDMVEKRE